jgi:hypothetical protein
MLKAVAVICVLISLSILSVTTPQAQEKTEIGGKLAFTFTDQKQVNVADAEGHMLSLSLSAAKNASAAPGGFMDGADVTNYSIGDLVKGNGPQFGYVMFAMGADTTYAKWEHPTTTVMSAEGKGTTTFKGTFNFIKGTGQYKDIQGGGDYTGIFTSPTTYSVEWKGDFAIKK